MTVRELIRHLLNEPDLDKKIVINSLVEGHTEGYREISHFDMHTIYEYYDGAGSIPLQPQWTNPNIAKDLSLAIVIWPHNYNKDHTKKHFLCDTHKQ